jgi:hypothetical protein
MNARVRESERRAARSYLTSRIIASVVLGLPSLAAIYGSAASLVHIADVEHLSDPRVLPFCLDLLAIGIVVSAVFCGHDDRLSRLTPWAAYGCSAALQVADVWTDPAGNLQPRAWAVHALPLAAAILGTEKILRLWRPEPAVKPQTGLDAEVAATALESGQSTAAATTPAPATARQHGAAHTTTARRRARQVTKAADVDPTVVANLRSVIAELGVTPADRSQQGWLDELRARDLGAHKSKVGAALRHITDEAVKGHQ